MSMQPLAGTIRIPTTTQITLFTQKITTMITEHPVSTFGHIYRKALYSHLKHMGNMLRMLRQARGEEISTVAAAINIRPKVLEQIENGEHDFRIKTLYALCDHYKVDEKLVVGPWRTSAH